MGEPSQDEVTHTQEYEKTYDDIFGDSDDEDEGVPMAVANATSAPTSTSSALGDDLFPSDDDNDNSPSGGRLSRLSRGGEKSGDKKKKKKKDKDKEKDKKKKKKRSSDGDGEDRSLEPRKRQRSAGSSSKNYKVEEKVSSGDAARDSGDEYDSEPELQRTEEDDKFIDENDDDDDLVKDYNTQTQQFIDDKPISHKKSGSSSSGGSSGGGASGKAKDPYSMTLESMKRRRGKELTDQQREGVTKSIIEKMDRAYAEDVASAQRGEVALAKIKLMPEVEKTVGIKTLQNTLLERNVLEVLKSWIEPRGDKSLTSLSVRTGVYKLLLSLPCQIDHLRRCAIGKTIYALRKHKQETAENKRLLKELIEKWSRPIFANQADSVRMDNQKMIQEAILNKSKSSPAEAEVIPKQFDISSARVADQGISRVRVPFGEGFMFTVQPESKVDKNSAREISVGATKSELLKRMQTNKKHSKKSVDGGRILHVELSGRNKK